MSVTNLIVFFLFTLWKSYFFVFVNIKSKKILGVDYGDLTIGLAIYDVMTDFCYPYKTIFRNKSNILRKSIREIVDIISGENIDEVVIGLPLNADGSEGERVEKVKAFATMLASRLSGIEINFQDERYSTIEAENILRERNIKKSEEKKYIDQVAAEIILNDYMKERKRV